MAAGNITGYLFGGMTKQARTPCQEQRQLKSVHCELMSDGNTFFADFSSMRIRGQQMKAIRDRFEKK